jgi:polar amino acid transport system ATP-binding protein
VTAVKEVSTADGAAAVSGPAIDVRGLRKSFGTLEVLAGIDFSVARGEVVCVIGPSGSGKSTLLRCVNLLEEPTSGTVMVAGVNRRARKDRVRA